MGPKAHTWLYSFENLPIQFSDMCFVFVVVGTSLGLNHNFPAFQISIPGGEFKKIGESCCKEIRGTTLFQKDIQLLILTGLIFWLKCAIIKLRKHLTTKKVEVIKNALKYFKVI